MAAEHFDQPIVFAVAITLTVFGMAAVLAWIFASMGWTGWLSLLKGGVMQ